MFHQFSKAKKKKSKDEGSLEQKINLFCDNSPKPSEVLMTGLLCLAPTCLDIISNMRLDVQLQRDSYDFHFPAFIFWQRHELCAHSAGS